MSFDLGCAWLLLLFVFHYSKQARRGLIPESVLKESLDKGDKPEIFNTDQGSQFTSAVFTGMLSSYPVKISMDANGRATDNAPIERLWRKLKRKKIYLNRYENGKYLWNGVREWMQ